MTLSVERNMEKASMCTNEQAMKEEGELSDDGDFDLSNKTRPSRRRKPFASSRNSGKVKYISASRAKRKRGHSAQNENVQYSRTSNKWNENRSSPHNREPIRQRDLSPRMNRDGPFDPARDRRDYSHLIPRPFDPRDHIPESIPSRPFLHPRLGPPRPNMRPNQGDMHHSPMPFRASQDGHFHRSQGDPFSGRIQGRPFHGPPGPPLCPPMPPLMGKLPNNRPFTNHISPGPSGPSSWRARRFTPSKNGRFKYTDHDHVREDGGDMYINDSDDYESLLERHRQIQAQLAHLEEEEKAEGASPDIAREDESTRNDGDAEITLDAQQGVKVTVAADGTWDAPDSGAQKGAPPARQGDLSQREKVESGPSSSTASATDQPSSGSTGSATPAGDVSAGDQGTGAASAAEAPDEDEDSDILELRRIALASKNNSVPKGASRARTTALSASSKGRESVVSRLRGSAGSRHRERVGRRSVTGLTKPDSHSRTSTGQRRPDSSSHGTAAPASGKVGGASHRRLEGSRRPQHRTSQENLAVMSKIAEIRLSSSQQHPASDREVQRRQIKLIMQQACTPDEKIEQFLQLLTKQELRKIGNRSEGKRRRSSSLSESSDRVPQLQDNYEEVEMDIDSNDEEDAGTRLDDFQFDPEIQAAMKPLPPMNFPMQDQTFSSMSTAAVPGPWPAAPYVPKQELLPFPSIMLPPPPPPADDVPPPQPPPPLPDEPPPKPPLPQEPPPEEDRQPPPPPPPEEDEGEDYDEAEVLREQLLLAMAQKKKDVEVKQEEEVQSRVAKPSVEEEATKSAVSGSSVLGESVDVQGTVPAASSRDVPSSSTPWDSTPTLSPPPPPPTLPVLNPLVIPMDSSDEEGESSSAPTAFSLGGLDRFLKDARKSVEVESKEKKSEDSAEVLETAKRLHQQRCEEVRKCEQEYFLEREAISREQVFLCSLMDQVHRHRQSLRKAENKRNALREQLAAYEKIVCACKEQHERTEVEITRVKKSLVGKQGKLREQEQQVRRLGQLVHGPGYSMQRGNAATDPPPAKKPRLELSGGLTITVAEEGSVGEVGGGRQRKVALAGSSAASLKKKAVAAAGRGRVVVAAAAARQKAKSAATSVSASAAQLPANLTKAQQKIFLQRLEQEYATKIRALKEQQLHHVPVPRRVEAVKPQSPQQLPPQPASSASLDIIKLEPPATVDSEEGEENQPAVPRRRSLQDLDSSTRPNLPITPARQNSGEPKASGAAGEDGGSSEVKSECNLTMPGSKHLGNLREFQQQKMERVLNSVSQPSSGGSPSPLAPPSPVPFSSLLPPTAEIPGLKFKKKPIEASDSTCKNSVKLAYTSPLLMFGAYRFSPYFRTKENMSLSSFTLCNKLDPSCVLCRYDLQGTCHDQDCAGQHLSAGGLTELEQLEDVVSYNPGLAGVDPSTASPEEIATAVRAYVAKLVRQHEGKMTHDELLLLLTSKVTEHSGHVRPFTMFYTARKWKPGQEKGLPQKINVENPVRKNEFEALEKLGRVTCSDGVVLSEDVRYFGGSSGSSSSSGSQPVRDLECAVVDSPHSVHLWLQLADRILGDSEKQSEVVLNKALNVLARGVEANKDSLRLWQRYLSLYSLHHPASDVADLFQTALTYCPDYSLWWQYLDASGTVEEKVEVVGRLLEYLVEEGRGAGGGASSPRLSHQVLETLLYRANLHTQAGFCLTALQEIKEVLEEEEEKRELLGLLTKADLCVLWSSFIHLLAFHRLPPRLLPPHNHNPGPLLAKELVAWTFEEELHVPVEEVVAAFQAAIRAVTSPPPETSSPAPFLEAGPLLKNLVLLLRSQSRWEEACKVCREMLERCPALEDAWLTVADLYVSGGHVAQARCVLSEAVNANSLSAKLYFYLTQFEIAQGDLDGALEELEQFAIRHFAVPDNHSCDPNALYCHLLGLVPPFRSQPLPPLQPGTTRESLQQQQPYLWLNYCLLLELQGAGAEAVEVFETALSTTVAADQLPLLWMSYLQFQQRNLQSGRLAVTRDQLQQLMVRSVTTTPTKFPRPFAAGGESWVDYGHVNRLVAWHLSQVPPEERPKAWETFLELMPSNVELLLGFCGELVARGELRRAQSLCSAALCERIPNVDLWKMVLALALKQGSSKEVEKLYLQASQALPYTVSLWKDLLLFEMIESHKESAEQILAHCRQLGLRIQGFVATLSS